ncbi:hypothetical protein PHJA_002348000 [Phtheirospermum japonicum]|uniref:Uncharacterized protein n=1 Tax=Phtheirospermum japonicum TaxID=374723 RepID=A0A830CQ59_9LAMI|nr:hypothetical protein PHJA_002348000 [Phtheirospermum japonicum]
MENQHVSEGLSDWEQIQSPLSVFPPGNHENLPVTNPLDNNDQHFQEQEPTDLLSPSTNGDGVWRWQRPRLEVLQNGIFRFAGNIKKYATCKIGLVSFAWSAFGVAGLVMVYFLHRRVLIWWQRRMHTESSKDSLMINLIREKDKCL